MMLLRLSPPQAPGLGIRGREEVGPTALSGGGGACWVGTREREREAEKHQVYGGPPCEKPEVMAAAFQGNPVYSQVPTRG